MRGFLRDFIESMLAGLLAVFLITALLSIILPPVPNEGSVPKIQSMIDRHR